MNNTPAGEELIHLIESLKLDYPQWSQRHLISQMRRSIPDYNHGLWSAAMPLNRGPSELPEDVQQQLNDLRQRETLLAGIDLAHILTSLDVYLSADFIDDTFVSWSGDLGSEAVHSFATGRDVAVGTAGSLADIPDLWGDIDGDNIARHARKGYELDDAIAYYGYRDLLSGTPSVGRRFSTFLADLDLLDDRNELRENAAQPEGILAQEVRKFVYWDALAESLAGHELGKIWHLVLHPGMKDSPELNTCIETAVEQFANILRQGLAAEGHNTD